MICGIMFISNCEKDPTGYQYVSDDGRVIATVHGIVQNAQSFERITNVTVSYWHNNTINTTTTDASGYYSISGLISGQYEFTFSGPDNYATTNETVVIPTIDQIRGEYPSEKDYKYSVTKNAILYEKIAGVTGRLYARDDKGDLTSANGVTIIANFASSGVKLEPAIYTTTTDEEGKFTFDKNLPALRADLYSLSFNHDGIFYDAAFSGYIYLVANVNVKIDDLIAYVASEEAKILSSPFNEDDFPIDGNISIVFSKAMNTSTFKTTLEDLSFGTIVYCTTSWENNSSLTIDPYKNLEIGRTYYLTLEGSAEDNTSFYESGYFYTVELDEALIIDSPINQTDFPVDDNIVILFSKSMDPLEFEIELHREYSWGEELYFETAWSDNNTKVTLDPYVILREGTQYYLMLEGKDAEGVDFYGSGYFETESSEEIEPIKLIRTNLEIIDGEYREDFPIDENIVFEFNVAIDTTIWYSIVLQNTFDSSYPDLDISLSPDSKIVTINPDINLEKNTEYSLYYYFYDHNYNYVSDTIYFYTQDQ
jgi:hypothetical protein